MRTPSTYTNRLASLLPLLLGAGCPDNTAQVRNPTPSIQTKWATLPDPTRDEKISLDTVYIGTVGKQIERDQYTASMEFTQPMQLRCHVSYRPLGLRGEAYSTSPELNFIVAGPGAERPCTEVPLMMRKDINCTVKGKGLAKVTIESANPNMSLGFGFYCSQTVSKSIPEEAPSAVGASPKRSQGLKNPADIKPPKVKPPEPPPPSKPSITTLSLRLDVTSEGRDDRHKILTLTPCTQPLTKGGKATIGKSQSRSFTIHKAKSCEIEVADVPESLLETDTPVILTQ